MTDHPEPVAVTAALLPCPFCGGEAAWPEPEVNMDYVTCKECTACHRNEAAWNRRTPTPTDAAPVSDAFGALTTALYDLDNTSRLSDNPSAVPAARDRAKTLLDWMHRHGVTVVPLRADDDALGDAVDTLKRETGFLYGVRFDELHKAIRVLIARAQSGGVRGWPADAAFQFGDKVTTPRGPFWQGPVCGWYRNSEGRLGFNVEADAIPLAIHNYPQTGLLPAPPATDEGK